MFYAWSAATDFAVGFPPYARSTSHDALVRKMREKNHRSFFTAHQLDGTWVDLTVFDSSKKKEGGLVSDERTNRYVRSRARRLEEQGQREVNQYDELLYADGRSLGEASQQVSNPEPPAPEEPSGENPYYEEEPAGREQFQLNIDPAVVKALYEFLALDQETREKAINALTALSVTAEPFKSAVQVMLDDTKELTVGFAVPAPEEDPSS